MAQAVQSFESVAAIRKRPGMYVGDCHDGTGLHHLVWELVANIIDLYLPGRCQRLSVTVHADGSVCVADDGPGIPVEAKLHGRPFLEVVATVFHAGPTLDGHAKHVHLAAHGVGIVAVNAVSSSFIVDVARNGRLYRQAFASGLPLASLADVGETGASGTSIAFHPDPKIFSSLVFDGELLREQLRQIAFLNPGLTVRFVDERTEFQYPQGVVDFAEHIVRRSYVVPTRPIHARGEERGIRVEAAFTFRADAGTGDLRSFANQHRTNGGGTHVLGMRNALNVLRPLTRDFSTTGWQRVTERLADRVMGVLSVTHFDPSFDSPTRSVLANREVTGVVERIVGLALSEWMEAEREAAQQLVRALADT